MTETQRVTQEVECTVACRLWHQLALRSVLSSSLQAAGLPAALNSAPAGYETISQTIVIAQAGWRVGPAGNQKHMKEAKGSEAVTAVYPSCTERTPPHPTGPPHHHIVSVVLCLFASDVIFFSLIRQRSAEDLKWRFYRRVEEKLRTHCVLSFPLF